MKSIGAGLLSIILASIVLTAAVDPLVVRLPNIDGHAQWLTDYRSRVVLLNFWSTTCGPCKVETPWLVEFQQRWRDNGFVVLGVSVDDPPERIRTFMKTFNINYPMFEGRNADEEIDKATGGLWGLPTSFLIARDGTVIKKRLGIPSKGELEREIQTAVAARR